MIIKLISRCFFIYFILYGKWNLAQSQDPNHISPDATHTDISLQDPNNTPPAVSTHIAPAITPPANGVLNAATPAAQHIASPAAQNIATPAAQHIASPAPISAPTVAVPTAGIPIPNQITSGAQPQTIPMAGSPTLGAPINIAAQPVTIPMGAGIPVGTQAIPAPIPGAQPNYIAAPGAPISTPRPITIGAQAGVPIVPGAQVFTTPITHGTQVITIPTTEEQQQATPPPKPVYNVSIDIRVKESTQHIKYRFDENTKTDIWYAIDGNLINEIKVNGIKKWPEPNEAKECKKVLLIPPPEADKKPTLKVLYEDEDEAYDPDNPPAKTSTDTNPDTAEDSSGTADQTQEAQVISHTPGSDWTSGKEEDEAAPPAEQPLQQSQTMPTTITSDASQTIVEPSQLIQTAETTPAQTTPVTPAPPAPQDQQASWTAPATIATGFTIPFESDLSSQTASDGTFMSHGSSILGAAHVDFSAHHTSPQMAYTPYDGKPYTDITLEDDEDSDEEEATTHGFHVEEIYGYDPEDDEEYQRVPLTQYVTNLGYRVGRLEQRMDPVEQKIEILSRLVDYQHQILEFSDLVKKKTTFDFDYAPGRFGGDVFRPATSQVSKDLEVTEHPSDVKLLVVDTNDATKYVDLGTDKYKVKQEGDEIQYVLGEGVECKLVTYKGKTVWTHRETDPHPIGIVFYPDDDKVVVDFDDAIVMYVKKGELGETIPLNGETTEVDNGLTEIQPNPDEPQEGKEETADQEAR